ncbi:nucleotidyl transferase AbiEii/AbiGii toxin family protein [soil metagenome]
MTDDYRDFLIELRRAGARFLVVGAHALAAHGIPRATVDLDIWIEPTPDNARRVWQALAQFGASLDALDVKESDLTRPEIVAQFGVAPNRIDILTSVTALEFAEAWAGRITADFEGEPVPFLGRESLTRNKRATGRTKDLADVEALGEPR